MGAQRSAGLLGTRAPKLTCRLRGWISWGNSGRSRTPRFAPRKKSVKNSLRICAHFWRTPRPRSLLSRSVPRLGVRSQDIRTWNDFIQLPILTKDIIRANQRDLVREDVPLEKLSPHFSGGSTAFP